MLTATLLFLLISTVSARGSQSPSGSLTASRSLSRTSSTSLSPAPSSSPSAAASPDPSPDPSPLASSSAAIVLDSASSSASVTPQVSAAVNANAVSAGKASTISSTSVALIAVLCAVVGVAILVAVVITARRRRGTRVVPPVKVKPVAPAVNPIAVAPTDPSVGGDEPSAGDRTPAKPSVQRVTTRLDVVDTPPRRHVHSGRRHRSGPRMSHRQVSAVMEDLRTLKERQIVIETLMADVYNRAEAAPVAADAMADAHVEQQQQIYSGFHGGPPPGQPQPQQPPPPPPQQHIAAGPAPYFPPAPAFPTATPALTPVQLVSIGPPASPRFGAVPTQLALVPTSDLGYAVPVPPPLHVDVPPMFVQGSGPLFAPPQPAAGTEIAWPGPAAAYMWPPPADHVAREQRRSPRTASSNHFTPTQLRNVVSSRVSGAEAQPYAMYY